MVACDDVNLEIQRASSGPARPSAAARPPRCAASPASSAPTTRTRSGSRDATSRACAQGPQLAFVFQDTAMFPNLSVRRNISFGLDMRKSLRQIRDRPAGRGRAHAGSTTCSSATRASCPAGKGSGRRSVAPSSWSRTRSAGRAACRARRGAARRDAHRDQADPAQARHHHDLRHPRSGGGADGRRQDRGDEGRRGPAGGHAAQHLPPAGEPVRRHLHRLAADQPLRVRAGKEHGEPVRLADLRCACRRRSPAG